MKHKKKIIIILPSINIGGTEKVLLQYADTLVKFGYEVQLVVIKKIKNEYFTVPKKLRFLN